MEGICVNCKRRNVCDLYASPRCTFDEHYVDEYFTTYEYFRFLNEYKLIDYIIINYSWGQCIYITDCIFYKKCPREIQKVKNKKVND